MDRYRTPQSFNSALSIGAPRPLRARLADEQSTVHATPSTRQYTLPFQGHAVQTDTPRFGGRHHLPADEHGTMQSPRMQMPEPELAESLGATTEDGQMNGRSGRGFMGSFMNGIRRIPKAMHKHHSRQSLYEEYAAEAQAASVRNSMMSPNMNRLPPLDNIPESQEGESIDIAESRRNQNSQETYEDGTTAVHPEFSRPIWPPINSPTYTNSQLDSRNSRGDSLMGPLPPDDSWAYYYARIVNFFIWLNNLPWKEDRIVNDFVPARDGRGGFGEKRPVSTWYKPKKRKSNTNGEKGNVVVPGVIIVPATPQSTQSSNYFGYGYGVPPIPPPPVLDVPIIASPSSDGGATAIRPTHTPMSVTSAGLPYMSPGMSSHGLGSQEVTYSWYSSTPMQWPAYLSQVSSPQTQTRIGTGMYSFGR